MASFPHIKEDPPNFAAAAAHEGGLSNSSCASHGAKQEDVVKKQRVRSEQNPWKKQHFWAQSGQHPWKKAALTFLGATRAKREQIPGKKQPSQEIM